MYPGHSGDVPSPAKCSGPAGPVVGGPSELRTFARRFNEEVGMSPGRWLIQQRVGRGRHLLESTDLRVFRFDAHWTDVGAISWRRWFRGVARRTVGAGIFADQRFKQLRQVLRAQAMIVAPGFAPASAIGKTLGVVAPVHQHPQPDLLHIVQTANLLCLALGLGQRRQQQAGENGDDRNDHQKLNQCECPGSASPAMHSRSFDNGANSHAAMACSSRCTVNRVLPDSAPR